jgi:HK97 family phage major capsid protein
VRRDELQRLIEQRNIELEAMTRLADSADTQHRAFTSQENQQFRSHQEKLEEIDGKIAAARAIDTGQRNTPRLGDDLGIERRGSVRDDGEVIEYRHRARVTDTAAATTLDAIDSPEYRAAWQRWLAAQAIQTESGGWRTLISAEDEALLTRVTAEYRALSRITQGGGFLVPTDVRNEIVSALRQSGPLQGLATTILTEDGRAMNLPTDFSHGSAQWVAENAAVTASDETLTQVAFSAYRATSKVIASEELLQDSTVNLERFIQNELGDRIGQLEETAFMVGDGSGKPLGLATAGNGVSILQAAAGAGNVTTFTYTALVNFVYSLPYQYRKNASWVLSDGAVKNLALILEGGTGKPMFPEIGRGGGEGSLIGFPIYTSPDLAAPAASAKVGVFGDIRQGYRIRRVAGVGLQRQNELHSDNGQVGFRGWDRVDGKPVLTDAVRVLQQAAT